MVSPGSSPPNSSVRPRAPSRTELTFPLRAHCWGPWLLPGPLLGLAAAIEATANERVQWMRPLLVRTRAFSTFSCRFFLGISLDLPGRVACSGQQGSGAPQRGHGKQIVNAAGA